MDAFCAQRIDGDGGGEGAVDPAREAQKYAGKSVLFDVIAQAEFQGIVYILVVIMDMARSLHSLRSVGMTVQ